MSTWARVKETMDQSDELSAALARLNELHMALIECHDVEGLRSLTNIIEALAAANGPKG